jgi:uncharacterized protein (TIGR02996 family)
LLGVFSFNLPSHARKVSGVSGKLAVSFASDSGLGKNWLNKPESLANETSLYVARMSFPTARSNIMSDHDAFLRTIFDEPDDDTPRLVYADWLQENGDEVYAEFIRIQCARAQTSLDNPEWKRLSDREIILWDQLYQRFRKQFSSTTLALLNFHRGFPDRLLTLDALALLLDSETWWPTLPFRRIKLRRWDEHYRSLARCSYLKHLEQIELGSLGFLHDVYNEGVLAFAESPKWEVLKSFRVHFHLLTPSTMSRCRFYLGEKLQNGGF